MKRMINDKRLRPIISKFCDFHHMYYELDEQKVFIKAIGIVKETVPILYLDFAVILLSEQRRKLITIL